MIKIEYPKINDLFKIVNLETLYLKKNSIENDKNRK